MQCNGTYKISCFRKCTLLLFDPVPLLLNWGRNRSCILFRAGACFTRDCLEPLPRRHTPTFLLYILRVLRFPCFLSTCPASLLAMLKRDPHLSSRSACFHALLGLHVLKSTPSLGSVLLSSLSSFEGIRRDVGNKVGKGSGSTFPTGHDDLKSKTGMKLLSGRKQRKDC